MNRSQASRGVEPGATRPGALTALPRGDAAAGTGPDAVPAEPARQGFARGAVIGLAIVVPFWLAVAALLFWMS